jgi:hypothetical protein
MSVREHQTPTHGATPDIEVRNPAGSVRITAVEGAEELSIRVEALDEAAEQLLDRVDIDVSPATPGAVGSRIRVRVMVPDKRLSFRTPAFAVEVSTPAGAAARIAVASADVELRGRMDRLDLTSASGETTVESCTELQLRSASGDARVGVVTGAATIGSASGDLRLESAGHGLQVRTASGDVSVGYAAGEISISTASGDVSLAAVGAGRVQLKSVSGDTTIGVVPGLRVWLDLSSVSGRMDSQLVDDDTVATEGPAQLSLSLRSVSGDLRLRRAAPRPAGSPPAAA